MEQITFAQQLHGVWIEPRAYGDLDYRQRANWNLKNRIQRERANLLFSRVEQCVYNLANDIEANEILSTGRDNEYIAEISDDIGRIVFEVTIDSNSEISIIIDHIIWYFNIFSLPLYL